MTITAKQNYQQFTFCNLMLEWQRNLRLIVDFRLNYIHFFIICLQLHKNSLSALHRINNIKCFSRQLNCLCAIIATIQIYTLGTPLQQVLFRLSTKYTSERWWKPATDRNQINGMISRYQWQLLENRTSSIGVGQLEWEKEQQFCRKIVQQKLAYAGHVLRGSSGRNALVIL